MKHAIAIAKAKVKEKFYPPWNRQLEDDGNLDKDISITVLGTLMVAGAVIGISGLFFLFNAVIAHGGLSPLLRSFLSAIIG